MAGAADSAGLGEAAFEPPVPLAAVLHRSGVPWYILHQSLIIVMLYWLMPLQLNAWLEPALVIAATVIGCLALHESVIRRVRWLRPLFGLTGPSPATTPAPAAPPDIRPMKASTCRYLCC